MSITPLSSLPETPLTIHRALLSVSDKTSIVPLAQKLHEHGVELISTGGTAQHLRDNDLPVKDVSEITGFPEILDGRVKTLHPFIHGGVLARTSHEPDKQELSKHDIQPIELVVANLYPFQESVEKEGDNLAATTEFIDIGGPTLLRAAAKNFAHVCVLTSPDQYEECTGELDTQKAVSFDRRMKFAHAAFQHTAGYDSQISSYLEDQLVKRDQQSRKQENFEIPERFMVNLPRRQVTRYGENPHQSAAVFGTQNQFIDCFHGKELSYNNYLDIDAALRLMADFRHEDPTCAIFKHTVPSGVSTGYDLGEAYKNAFKTDTVSPFGGIVAVNAELDEATAAAIDKIFTEVILAPSYSPAALKLLQQKKNRRLVTIKEWPLPQNQLAYRSIFGGALVQQADPSADSEDDRGWNVVTERKPNEDEERDLRFAWKIVKHVTSNAIVYAHHERTLGIGTGQPNRVDASRFAVLKAKNEELNLRSSAIASDAFFPFADGVSAAAEAGATAVIQPGGSIRDDEVIAEADKHDMAMIFTGKRHFRH